MSRTGKLISILVVAAVFLPFHADAGGTGDFELLELVTSEYESLSDFGDRLSRLENALAERDDRRAVFAALYVVLTDNATQLIENGHFDDGEWVAAFMVAFGNLYRQAFFDFESGNISRVPETWRVTFEAAAADEITVFQHALLGIHSHINRDMPYAIAQVTPARERSRRLRDFVRTNDFIVASIEAVEDRAATFDTDLAVLDVNLGQLDENLIGEVLSVWRFRAWRLATSVNGANTVADRFFSAYVDHAAARRAVQFRDSQTLFELGSRSGMARAKSFSSRAEDALSAIAWRAAARR